MKEWIVSVGTRFPVCIECVRVVGNDMEEAKEAALEELKEALMDDYSLVWNIEEFLGEDEEEA
jgi:hypothetical protein